MVDQGKALKDRRRHPRVLSNMPVKICGEDFEAVTETKNLSRSGVFCRINKCIEPMTKFKIQLLLSYKKNNKLTTKKISCEGVVVRAEQTPGKEEYNTAIYFNDISEKDVVAITDYVHCMLNKAEKREE